MEMTEPFLSINVDIFNMWKNVLLIQLDIWSEFIFVEFDNLYWVGTLNTC